MKIGRLIIIEGPDGVGKTTIAKKLVNKLNAKYFREPGSSKIGEEIRELLFKYGDDIHIDTQFYLFNAARNELFVKELQECFNRGEDVILDRSFLSSIVYQDCLYKQLEVLSYILKNMECDFNMHLFYITLPLNIIEEGQISDANINILNISKQDVEKIARKNNINIQDVLVGTLDENSKFVYQLKDGVKSC